MANPDYPGVNRLVLETQMDSFVEEYRLSSVIHALVEVTYRRVRSYTISDPARAESLSGIARGLTELELESESWGL